MDLASFLHLLSQYSRSLGFYLDSGEQRLHPPPAKRRNGSLLDELLAN